MKLMITITGPKVHDVVYRYFLLGGARRHRILGFSADNLMGPNGQEIEILLEGKETQVKAFEGFVRNNKPDGATVSDITTSDYGDEVPRHNEYSQEITAMQMLKAIPVLLAMRNDLGVIKENTAPIPEIREDLKAVKGNTDTIPQIQEVVVQFRQLQADMKAVKERLGMP